MTRKSYAVKCQGMWKICSDDRITNYDKIKFSSSWTFQWKSSHATKPEESTPAVEKQNCKLSNVYPFFDHGYP